MGVILQGILGGFSGKVGPVVGAKWKGIDYMRSYVIPENPNTLNQQTQRTKFSAIVAIARQVLSTLLQPFWDMYYTNKSGFNAFISENINTLDGSNKLQVSSIMSKGTLDGVASITATYNTGDGEIVVTFDDTVEGNGLATDIAYLVVYDVAGNKLALYTDNDERSSGTTGCTISSGLTATSVIVWLFFTQGTGSSLIVSDSVGDVCAAP